MDVVKRFIGSIASELISLKNRSEPTFRYQNDVQSSIPNFLDPEVSMIYPKNESPQIESLNEKQIESLKKKISAIEEKLRQLQIQEKQQKPMKKEADKLLSNEVLQLFDSLEKKISYLDKSFQKVLNK